MKKYKKYEEIKKELIINKNRPFDELFEESFFESLNLVEEIVLQSYVSPSLIQEYPRSPTAD